MSIYTYLLYIYTYIYTYVQKHVWTELSVYTCLVAVPHRGSCKAMVARDSGPEPVFKACLGVLVGTEVVEVSEYHGNLAQRRCSQGACTYVIDVCIHGHNPDAGKHVIWGSHCRMCPKTLFEVLRSPTLKALQHGSTLR